MTGSVRTAIVVLAALGRGAAASPDLPLDDPAYVELARLRALGALPPYLGGIRPLTEARARALVAPGGAARARPAPRAGWWARPLARAVVRITASSGAPRPYSTSRRPRDVAGAIATACERGYERPCDRGGALGAELDSAAGHGGWLSVAARGRATAGSDDVASTIALDRAVIAAETSIVRLAVGRDVFVLGPAARTQLMWSRHAPPVDGVRVATARPLALAGTRGDVARGSAFYALVRPRAPQAAAGNLVSVARLQLDLFDALELGGSQILQLGGAGAAPLDVAAFVLEHVRRRDASAGAGDSSNRRVSLDLAFRIAPLGGVRVYYELAFEDVRRQLANAARFDADHVVGVEHAGSRRHGLVVELARTGFRSHEHAIRTTGLTSEGRVLGSPLGPGAGSVFIGGWLAVGSARVQPSLELARLASDTYSFPHDSRIVLSERGAAERRVRAGLGLELRARPDLRVDGELIVERTTGRGFDPRAREHAISLIARLVYAPG